MTVAAVATSNKERAQRVRAELPEAAVVRDLNALLELGDLDVVVLASPSGVHAEQAMAVITAGVPLVVDKPLATDANQALEVVEAAAAAGVPLTVFQNRRFDPEHVAARETVRSGLLGEVFRHEFRWAAEGGGILLDLHSHMIDAAVDLFGPIETVHAELAARTTVAEDDAFLSCRHTSGVVSHLGATSVSAAPGPRVRILGLTGAFLLNEFEDDGADIYPDLANGGAGNCGWIYAGQQRTPVTRPAAGQVDFYRQVMRALAAADPQADMPVDPYDAIHTLAVIDAARVSAAQGTVVQVRTPGQR